MICKISKGVLLLFILVSCTSPQKPYSLADFELLRNRDFNNGWKFSTDSISGAEQPGFNDSGWRNVELPHDWTIENNLKPIINQQVGIFSKKTPAAHQQVMFWVELHGIVKHFLSDAKIRTGYSSSPSMAYI